ncbi:DegV family protein [Peptoniphilus sp. SGI.035]|uniref:DegV family protein n=1 Tax=Peptoniphilus sp. SGI.035 TaxID=3420564 RepID=UPI003D0770DC
MYKIISDTSCDLTKEEIKDLGIEYVPFKISIDGVEYEDDDNLNIQEYLDKMEKTENPIKTACPSPYDYLKIIEKNIDKDIYISTISSKLSGSYNSAKVAEQEARDKFKGIKIHVIDTKSASAGHTRIILKLLDLLKDKSFEEVVPAINKEVENEVTMFVLENMKNLIKNGRIKKSAGLIANVLNIRPIMISNDGEIELFEINRGIKKSLDKMVKAIGKECRVNNPNLVTLSYVRNEERAEKIKEKIEEMYDGVKVHVRHTNGLSSGYADIGGIVIAF